MDKIRLKDITQGGCGADDETAVLKLAGPGHHARPISAEHTLCGPSGSRRAQGK